MSLAEIAYKIMNNVLRIEAGQSVVISAELYNVFDYSEPLAAVPFLEELALVVRKNGCMPFVDISTENMHKRYFEEVSEDNQALSTALFYKWADSGDVFVDLSWRSNPIFYRSIPERAFNRLNPSPKDFLQIFEKKGKKLVLLGYPTKGLAQYYDIEHDTLKETYFSSLNVDYFELKKKCLIFDGKMRASKTWSIATENRLLQIELTSTSKCCYGEFVDGAIIVLPTGSWQQEISLQTLNGIIYLSNVYYEHYIWQGIQLVFENGKLADVETDIQQKNLNLLKTILFSEIETMILNIGLNDNIKKKSLYSLFDMAKNGNLSLVLNTERGQVIALSEAASLFESNENNVLYEI